MTFWDTKDLGGAAESSYEENMRELILKLNNDADPCKHIHCIWYSHRCLVCPADTRLRYVVDNPVWQAVDERICKQLLSTQSHVPFSVILNKVRLGS